MWLIFFAMWVSWFAQIWSFGNLGSVWCFGNSVLLMCKYSQRVVMMLIILEFMSLVILMTIMTQWLYNKLPIGASYYLLCCGAVEASLGLSFLINLLRLSDLSKFLIF